MNQRVRAGLSNVVLALAVFLFGVVLSNTWMGAPLMLAAFVAGVVGLIRVGLGLVSQPTRAHR